MGAVDEVAACERRFRRAGLPLLIEDYSARDDVFTRAVPLLGLVFAGEVLGAVDLKWSFLANIAAAVGGVAILLGTLALVNRAAGRPTLARPDRVGRVELAAFVVVPAVLPLAFGFQPVSAAVTAAGNAALLAVIYGVVGYALPSIVRWAAARLLAQLAASLALLSRALPLLLLFAVLLLFTTEMWQVFASVSRAALAAIAVLLVVFGAVFLAARLPREVERLEREAGAGGPPLTTRQRRNVGLVLFVSHGLQTLVVVVAVAIFFTAFGVLAITPKVRDTWTGTGMHHVIFSVRLLGERMELSEELLRVAGAIAAFSGLYYAIAVLTDSAYREEFLDEITAELRAVFADRLRYLELLRQRRGATPQSP
ncbi:MAG: hypothetical protein JWN32_2958 [Solirubrobacterales bacterium]|jgi:hypothetical protein|nr:hypothetical protein [Solirubrobacterales bacterium]